MALPLIAMHTAALALLQGQRKPEPGPLRAAAGREGERERRERMPWKVLLAKLSSEVRRGSEE